MGNWKMFQEDDDAMLDWDVLDQSRTHNPVNETTGITGGSWIVPGYDAAGNQTFGPKPGAEATAAEAHHYVWDAWNRVVEVWEDTNGDGDRDAEGTDTQVLECRYDGFNRRIAKTDKTGESDVTYDYYYNTSWQVLEVHLDGETDYPYKQYVWDLRYVHSPVLRWRDENTDGQDIETLYYCNDANFNVTALVEPDGDVVERYAYDPYGKVTIMDDSWNEISWAASKQNHILYCGYRFDNETGLYHVRRRYYHVTLGRWLQRDPIGYVDGMSLYEYVGSMPISVLDFSGLSSPPPPGAQRHGEAGLPEEEYTGKHKPDRTEPWGVGAEFMTGTGPRVHVFHEGDKFLKQLMASEHLKTVREQIRSQLHGRCYICNESPLYERKAGRSLAGMEGVITYAEDWAVNAPASVTQTDEFFGVNPSTVYLGSFGMEYWAKPIECCEGKATVRFHAWNKSSLASLTRPPGTGYIKALDAWRRSLMGWLEDVLPQRPTYQVFYWEEEIAFEGNKQCP